MCVWCVKELLNLKSLINAKCFQSHRIIVFNYHYFNIDQNNHDNDFCSAAALKCVILITFKGGTLPRKTQNNCFL